jgi:hypothetical protein
MKIRATKGSAASSRALSNNFLCGLRDNVANETTAESEKIGR